MAVVQNGCGGNSGFCSEGKRVVKLKQQEEIYEVDQMLEKDEQKIFKMCALLKQQSRTVD